MNVAFASLFAWLVDFSCLATGLLAAALAARMAVRQPVSRVLLSWATWFAILAGGLLLALPAWPRIEMARLLARPVEAPPVLSLHDSAPTQVVYLAVEPLARATLPHVDGASTDSTSGAISIAAIAVRVWVLIALLVCAWLAVGWARAWRLISRAQPAPDWIGEELRQVVGRRRRQPRVLTSKQVATPLALGTLRPRIMLPLVSASQSNAPAIRAALAHEWAHIASGDLWLLALERSLVPLLALHPLFWWLRRLTRVDQELAADAAAAGDRPAEYAAALLAWAKEGPHQRAGFAALAMWERPNNLSRRIRMLLDPNRNHTAGRSYLSTVVLLATLFALSLALSIVTWRPMTAQDQPQRPLALDVALPAPPPSELPIMVEMQLLSLDSGALASAKIDLPAIIKRDASRFEPRESGVISAELANKDVRELLVTLKNSDGADILSHPKVLTRNGREATIVVGGRVPVAEIDEIVNGERRERRIESKDFGTKFRVKPQILSEDPRMVVLEIAGETTALNPRREAGEDADHVPLLKSQKVELRATIELGKTLVLLAAAPEMRVEKGGPDIKEPEQSLLILLRPSVVEHKYVEVYPNPQAASNSPSPAAAPAPSAGPEVAFVDAVDETKLAEQLRSIRMALEELAREREATRRENAALKQELEHLKRLAQDGTSSSSAGRPAAVNAAAPSSAPQATHVYEFPTSELAKSAALRLGEGRAEKLRIAMMLQAQRLTIMGPPHILKDLRAELGKHGQLIAESLHGPNAIQATPVPAGPPADAVERGVEWLRAQQGPQEWSASSDQDQPSAVERQTYRRLLELDLEGAELELQAAQEDLEYSQKLYEKNSISQEEVRKNRRAVDKAKIQVARLKVLLEADRDPPAPSAPTPQQR